MRLNNIKQLSKPTISTLYILSLRRRKLDHDNLVGGCKQLIDALCDEGFVWDDCTNYLTSLQVEQVKAQSDVTLIRRVV